MKPPNPKRNDNLAMKETAAFLAANVLPPDVAADAAGEWYRRMATDAEQDHEIAQSLLDTFGKLR